MKKSLLSVALCVMTLLIGISPVSAQGQNKEYQETLHKMLLLSGGLATVDTMVPQIIGMMKQQSPSGSGWGPCRYNWHIALLFQKR